MNGADRIFYNTLPKSGTHMVKQHRHISPDNHVSLRLGIPDDYPTPDGYIKEIKRLHGDFTGHVPYSAEVRDYLHRNNIRHIFIFRNLRDVAASLAWYVTHPQQWGDIPESRTEFDLEVDGVLLSHREDVLGDAIRIVAEWWGMFKPWVHEADTLFTYEELRPAAFLCGHENNYAFHHGRINGWAYVYEPHHIELADRLLPDVIADYFSGRLMYE